jgi:two-component system sensor histidine kinase CpxA
MRSLFAKILLWFWFTLILTVVGSAFISALSVSDSDRRSPFARLLTFELAEARHAWETGGRAGLEAFFGRLHTIFDARGIFTDESGRDLLTGQDRSELLDRARRRPPLAPIRYTDELAARADEDGRYWLFLLMPRARVGSWFLLPEHWWVMGAAVLLCYALAYYLTQPVRQLQRAVERFARGDFSARAGSTRRDELGRLARTFDTMAGRMETLLAAERRLLLDISHELRSPLARLGVAVELARSGPGREAALDRIETESLRLNDLVLQLLEVTRGEVDPSTLRVAPVRLEEIVARVIEVTRIEAEARGCGLELLSSAAATVEGDAELLRRAVENVVRNAIHHAPPGSRVEVALTRHDGWAAIAIADHGPGVPEEAVGRLFDAFYRVESDRNRTSGGVGLGLAIARRAIELHKGSIRAENTHPGLRITMRLPVSPKPGVVE